MHVTYQNIDHNSISTWITKIDINLQLRYKILYINLIFTKQLKSNLSIRHKTCFSWTSCVQNLFRFIWILLFCNMHYSFYMSFCVCWLFFTSFYIKMGII